MRDARVRCLLQPGSDPISKTGRVIRCYPNIFVHMEEFDLIPVDMFLKERCDEWELGVACRRNDPRPAVCRDRLLDDLRRARRCCRSRAFRRPMHFHARLASLKLSKQSMQGPIVDLDP